MRSNFEHDVAQTLDKNNIDYDYEPFAIPYTKPPVPAKNSTYTPDFVFPNGVIVETKGKFSKADRDKHLLIREQWPALDIRLVFQRPKDKCFGANNKRLKQSVEDWCIKNGFMYAFVHIPMDWVSESINKESLASVEQLRATKLYAKGRGKSSRARRQDV